MGSVNKHGNVPGRSSRPCCVDHRDRPLALVQPGIHAASSEAGAHGDTGCIPAPQLVHSQPRKVPLSFRTSNYVTERTLITATAGPSPRDPYRHSLAMRPPRKVRPFCFLNYWSIDLSISTWFLRYGAVAYLHSKFLSLATTTDRAPRLRRGFALSPELSCLFGGGASGDASAATAVVRASYVSIQLRWLQCLPRLSREHQKPPRFLKGHITMASTEIARRRRRWLQLRSRGEGKCIAVVPGDFERVAILPKNLKRTQTKPRRGHRWAKDQARRAVGHPRPPPLAMLVDGQKWRFCFQFQNLGYHPPTVRRVPSCARLPDGRQKTATERGEMTK